MTTQPAVVLCDDARGEHKWAEPFTDGDTCMCGRFYLNRHPMTMGVEAVVTDGDAPLHVADDDPRRV